MGGHGFPGAIVIFDEVIKLSQFNMAAVNHHFEYIYIYT